MKAAESGIRTLAPNGYEKIVLYLPSIHYESPYHTPALVQNIIKTNSFEIR